MMIFKITVVVAVVYLLVHMLFNSYISNLGAIDVLRWSRKKYTPNEYRILVIIGGLRLSVYILLAVDVIYFVFTRF